LRSCSDMAKGVSVMDFINLLKASRAGCSCQNSFIYSQGPLFWLFIS
jgi:hypothetical protein